MNVLSAGRINLEVFDRALRAATGDLGELVVAAVETESTQIESTHVLMALGTIPNGATRKGFEKRGLTPDIWRSGLKPLAIREPGGLPPTQLDEASLHSSALATLKAAAASASGSQQPIDETRLLLAALENLTPKAAQGLRAYEFEVQPWKQELERELAPPKTLELWTSDPSHPDAPPSIDVRSFTPSGKKLLRLMKSEAEALGFETLDVRHVLFALLALETSTLNLGLYQQTLAPRKLHGAFLLHLRAKGKPKRSSVALDKPHLNGMLIRILESALKLAARDGLERASERHFCRAFLANASAARSFLADEGASLERLQASAEAPSDSSEEEPDDDLEVADVETVRQRLMQGLVGQQGAIERILPYIQRMRFGFTVPERPVGVFLFCGASGTGKTELAKELARAVYGSDENLVFLEMGQFNSPESMNIFVGAPPGYIGYGEGKLTNGLRDKPRAVVLFDEIEKSHQKVLDALLRFLDEGRIDDPAGPVRDGSQCIAILTSNVGVGSRTSPSDTANPHEALRQAFLAKGVRPEFLNRVDELILFNDLSSDDFCAIAERISDRLCRRLDKERAIHVRVAPAVKSAIGKECARLNEGARTVTRLVMTHVVTAVIDFVVRNKPGAPVKLEVMLASNDGEALKTSVSLAGNSA
jgi:ATP-dependent Clp protease ATP-binding subunit ClpA